MITKIWNWQKVILNSYSFYEKQDKIQASGFAAQIGVMSQIFRAGKKTGDNGVFTE